MAFTKREHEVGDVVKLSRNRCGNACGCFWAKHKARELSKSSTYKVVNITYFGGGCPPKYLILEGLGNKEYPANWFKSIKI